MVCPLSSNFGFSHFTRTLVLLALPLRRPCNYDWRCGRRGTAGNPLLPLIFGQRFRCSDALSVRMLIYTYVCEYVCRCWCFFFACLGGVTNTDVCENMLEYLFSVCDADNDLEAKSRFENTNMIITSVFSSRIHTIFKQGIHHINNADGMLPPAKHMVLSKLSKRISEQASNRVVLLETF